MMNKEEIKINCTNDVFKYTPDQIYDVIYDLQQRIDKTIELNKQIIKDTKSFYRPTSDTIYSGDCLIDIAEQNIEILGGKE